MTDLLKTKPEPPPRVAGRRHRCRRASTLRCGRGRMGRKGSDKPEKEEVKIGFIPLTDCASVVMASVLGIDKKYGVKIVPSKEASWAGVRDKLVNGELDFAHVLYGLVYGVHVGAGGPKKDMAVLMTLNNNGQAITLSKKLADKGAVDGAVAGQADGQGKRPNTPSPRLSPPARTRCGCTTGWRGNGINPVKDAKVITVPPPQMVANMRVGNMDGYCVGEPWGQRAIMDGIGITAITTQDIWKDHPEKVLGTTGRLRQEVPQHRTRRDRRHPGSRQVDRRQPANKNKMAETIADKSYVNTSVDAINQRILGRYTNGMGKTWDDPNYMKFYNDGAVNFPYLSDGMWFLTQHKRWGLLKEHPDYLAVAKQINRVDIYKQAAAAMKVSVPKDPMRTSKLIDGTVWDGKNPKQYADSFKVRA
jgi:nitrate/nitrite transport system substrate-binding protein